MIFATAFMDRIEATKLWFQSFKRLEFPRRDIKLVWINLSNNNEIDELLKNYLFSNSGMFKEVIYRNDIKKEHPDIVDDTDENGQPDFNKRRLAIVETMNILNSFREGDLVVWEDDVIVPPDGFKRLKTIFDMDETYLGVTGCQYSRRVVWPNKCLVWSERKKFVFPNDKYKGEEISFDHIEEKRDGYQRVDATGTGFILYRESFIKDYKFRDSGFGQDVMVGHDINEKGKLMLCWDVKCPHVGLDREGRLHIYRTALCETEVKNG